MKAILQGHQFCMVADDAIPESELKESCGIIYMDGVLFQLYETKSAIPGELNHFDIFEYLV